MRGQTMYKRLVEAKRAKELAGVQVPKELTDSLEYAKEARLFICAEVEKNLGEMVASMIKESMAGNVEAFKAIMDRAHGKPVQAMDIKGIENNPIVFMPLELIQKHSLEIAKQNVIHVKEDAVKHPVSEK